VTNRRQIQRRIDELEAEVRRRRSTSEIQAEFALENDNRDRPEADERKPEELTSSERQVRALTKGRGRGGRAWREVDLDA